MVVGLPAPPTLLLETNDDEEGGGTEGGSGWAGGKGTVRSTGFNRNFTVLVSVDGELACCWNIGAMLTLLSFGLSPVVL